MEKAIEKKPFDAFWTTDLTRTNGEEQKVMYQKQNKFEGRSAYFDYYPTD